MKWQECFDETTGCIYYWNVETNEVTWDVPKEMKTINDKTSTNIPNDKLASVTRKLKAGSAVKSARNKEPNRHPPAKRDDESDDEKIELISYYGQESDSEEDKPKVTQKERERKADTQPKPVLFPLLPDVPLVSHASMTTIYRIQPESPRPVQVGVSPANISTNLTKANAHSHTNVQVGAEQKVLEKAVSPKLPIPVKQNENSSEDQYDELFSEIEKEIVKTKQKDVDAPVTKKMGLVVGYGSGSDTDEDNDDGDYDLSHLVSVKKCDSPKTNSDSAAADKTPKSLFPIACNSSNSSPKINPYLASESACASPQDAAVFSSADDKPFTRKRRFDYDIFPNKVAKKYEPSPVSVPLHTDNTERVGFGYNTANVDELTAASSVSAPKPSVAGAKIAFVKAETIFVEPQTPLSPVVVTKLNESTSDSYEPALSEEDSKVQGDMVELVKEKIAFLEEGHDTVKPVQVMSIQLQTLLEAYKLKMLKQSYLSQWLNVTANDLLKLEQDAAPEGWLCQWDRPSKRYFYQHRTSGKTQWDYPVAEKIVKPVAASVSNPTIKLPNSDEDAMDISTTPPPFLVLDPSHPQPRDDFTVFVGPTLPQPVVKEIIPPPPPMISAPKTPPPPTISYSPEPALDMKCDQLGLIGVPGVPESTTTKITENPEAKSIPDKLGEELESFYSDIASLGVDVEPSGPVIAPVTSQTSLSTNLSDPDSKEVDTPVLVEVKKKKKKAKITGTLAYKKKEVSNLVEKWKKVQEDL